jgi:hypothetical protein
VPTVNGDVLSSLLVRFFYSQLIIFSRPEIGTGKGILVLILLHDMLNIAVKQYNVKSAFGKWSVHVEFPVILF